jgi:predicted nucleotidyltransferase
MLSTTVVAQWTDEGRAVAKEFARRVAERFGSRVERVTLFGSVARGTDAPDSDVDILVVARDPDRTLRDGLDAIAFDLTLSTHRSPVFVLYPAEVYARARVAGSELLAAVEREGVPLWTMSAERSSARA